MLLKVNPNRMELLRLRRRLELAKRGHKLLEDKLEQLLQKFSLLLKELGPVQKQFQEKTTRIVRGLIYTRLNTSGVNFEEILAGIKSEAEIELSVIRILNLKIPQIQLKHLKIEKGYSLFKAPAQLDLVLKEASDWLEVLFRFSHLTKSLSLLAQEIERTRRRVNALEYVLIPSLEETLRYILQKLNELERENLARLMRIKELVQR